MKCINTIFILSITLLLICSPVQAIEYTLEELQHIAKTQSPSIQSSLRTIEELELDIDIIQSEYGLKWGIQGISQISGDVTATTSTKISLRDESGLEASVDLSFTDLFGDKLDTTYSVSLQYPIYPGKIIDPILTQLESRTTSLQRAIWELETKQLEVEIGVWKRFYSALIMFERMNIAELEFERAISEREVYKELFQRGDVTELQLLDKEIGYKSSLASYERSQLAYINSLRDLFSYVGIKTKPITEKEVNKIKLIGSFDKITDLEIIDPSGFPPVEELHDMATKVSTLVKGARLDLEAAEEELERMKYSNGPKVNSTFEYNPGSAMREDDWIFIISAQYNIQDGGKFQSELKRQENRIDDLKENLESIKIGVMDELETKMRELKIAYTDYHQANLQLKRGEIDHQLYKEQHERDFIPDSQLESSARFLKGNELDYLRSRIDYQVAYWEWNIAIYSGLYEVIK